MGWCPEHAMNAYLKTLHLRKNYGIEASRTLGKSSRFDEPQIMEFLSALAAGNGAKLIVQITPEGVTPITTLALAVAAKQTGGKFVCIVPADHDNDKHHEKINRSSYIQDLTNGYDQDDGHLKDVAQFVVGGNPCEIIKQHKEIDFLVIDSKFGDDHLSLLKSADVNPKGSVVVFTNLFNVGRKKESVGEIVKEKYGIEYESVTLPVGEGIELTKILPSCKKFGIRRKCTRFHVTYI